MDRRVIAFLPIMLAVAANALEYREVWTAPGKGGVSAPNILRMPDGKNAIVVCERDLGVVCFDIAGKRLWSYELTPPVTAAPAVADVDGDGAEDVIAADSKGRVAALKADGSLLWEANIKAGVLADSCPAVSDLDGDGLPETLVGDSEGTLSCLDRSGALRWSFMGDGGQMGPVLVADIYDAPGLEVVVTSSDHHIYALDSAGRWIWDFYRANDVFPNSTPVFADTDGDGAPELYIGGGLNHFYRIDLAKPEIVLEENVYLHVNSAISAADLDGDGKDEVVFGNKGGALYCYSDGGFKWTAELKDSNLYAAPVFANVDDDAELEILAHSLTKTLHVIQLDGTATSTVPTFCEPTATPLVGDFDGDGMLDLISTTGSGFHGQGGIAFASLGVPFHELPRGTVGFAGSAKHTGIVTADSFRPFVTPRSLSAAGEATVTAVDALRIVSWENVWRFDVSNPEGKRLVLLTEIAGPDGAASHLVRHVGGSTARTALAFDAGARGTYRVKQRLLDADSRAVVAEAENPVEFGGLDSDTRYLMQELLPDVRSELGEWAKTNSRAAGDMSFTAATLEGALQKLDPFHYDSGLAGEIAHELERLQKLAKAGQTFAPEGPFAAWACDPWGYYHPRNTLPSAEDKTDAITAALCREEYESRALNVTNFTKETINIRVSCKIPKNPSDVNPSEHVAFRRAVLVPTVRREEVADALPELDSAGLLTIPPYETAQLWITLDAVGLESGDYAWDVILRSVEPDPTEFVIPISVTVHPLSLPRPRPLRFCLWVYDGGDLGTDKPSVLRDLIEHGTTVFFGPSPAAECDAQGNLTKPLDFTALDESVGRLQPRAKLLFLSPQGQIKGAPFLSEEWKKAFIEYLRQWASHMTSLGLDYSDWALYPYDEPSTPFADTTINLVKVAQIVREADPKIWIYTDPTSGTTM
ncbi:MAG: PQQ-binding-like beta-propeller repeat protein, partial [Candidatus Hydrogenedentes bacterium]|nr:PQQ-binding-like beta-propeller repeat protein [Candidatus Hydrogenedentota bacterium]